MSMIPSDEQTRVGSAGKIIISKDASKMSTVRNDAAIKTEEEFEFDNDQFAHNLEE